MNSFKFISVLCLTGLLFSCGAEEEKQAMPLKQEAKKILNIILTFRIF